MRRTRSKRLNRVSTPAGITERDVPTSVSALNVSDEVVSRAGRQTDLALSFVRLA